MWQSFHFVNETNLDKQNPWDKMIQTRWSLIWNSLIPHWSQIRFTTSRCLGFLWFCTAYRSLQLNAPSYCPKQQNGNITIYHIKVSWILMILHCLPITTTKLPIVLSQTTKWEYLLIWKEMKTFKMGVLTGARIRELLLDNTLIYIPMLFAKMV